MSTFKEIGRGTRATRDALAEMLGRSVESIPDAASQVGGTIADTAGYYYQPIAETTTDALRLAKIAAMLGVRNFENIGKDIYSGYTGKEFPSTDYEMKPYEIIPEKPEAKITNFTGVPYSKAFLNLAGESEVPPSVLQNMIIARGAQGGMPTANTGTSSAYTGVYGDISPSTRIPSVNAVNPYLDLNLPERAQLDPGRTFGAGMIGVLGDAIAQGLNPEYKSQFSVKDYISYLEGLRDKQYQDALQKLGFGVKAKEWDVEKEEKDWERAYKQRAQEIDENYKQMYRKIQESKSSGLSNPSVLRFLMNQKNEEEYINDEITRYAVQNDLDPRIATAIYKSAVTGVAPSNKEHRKIYDKHVKKLYPQVSDALKSYRMKRPVMGFTSGGWFDRPVETSFAPVKTLEPDY